MRFSGQREIGAVLALFPRGQRESLVTTGGDQKH